MNFEIEQNVVMPEKHARYPFNQMEVGDSFFVPEGANTPRQNTSSAASYAGHRLGRKFTTRLVDGGVRVWRFE